MYFMKNKFLLATHFNFVTKEAARQRSPFIGENPFCGNIRFSTLIVIHPIGA